MLISGSPGQWDHPEVDRCIYCPSVIDLTNEHIVPQQIGGTVMLLRASCPKCNAMTEAFETVVFRRWLESLRTLYRAPFETESNALVKFWGFINGRPQVATFM